MCVCAGGTGVTLTCVGDLKLKVKAAGWFSLPICCTSSYAVLTHLLSTATCRLDSSSVLTMTMMIMAMMLTYTHNCLRGGVVRLNKRLLLLLTVTVSVARHRSLATQASQQYSHLHQQQARHITQGSQAQNYHINYNVNTKEVDTKKLQEDT